MMGPPYGKRDPYYSQGFETGSAVQGIVWVPLTIFGGPKSPWGVPENSIESWELILPIWDFVVRRFGTNKMFGAPPPKGMWPGG